MCVWGGCEVIQHAHQYRELTGSGSNTGGLDPGHSQMPAGWREPRSVALATSGPQLEQTNTVSVKKEFSENHILHSISLLHVYTYMYMYCYTELSLYMYMYSTDQMQGIRLV